MFESLKGLSLPIMVTDSSNVIVFKNITASKCFATLRIGQYVTKCIVGENIAEEMDACFKTNTAAILTLRLPEYECSCIAISRTVEGNDYRFYTVIPYILEFYDADSMLIADLLDAFGSSIEKQIGYIDAGLSGVEDEASDAIKGRIRSDARKLIALENVMKLRLGASSGMPQNKEVYLHKVNLYDDIHKLIENFNNEYGKETLIVEYAEQGHFCEKSRSAFGRLFTYTALHCVKFSRSDIRISLSKKDNDAYIEFRVGVDYSAFPKLFEVYFSYIQSYAETYGFEVYMEKCTKGSRIVLKSECIDFSSGSVFKSYSKELDVSKDFLSAILAEAEAVFALLGDKIS